MSTSVEWWRMEVASLTCAWSHTGKTSSDQEPLHCQQTWWARCPLEPCSTGLLWGRQCTAAEAPQCMLLVHTRCITGTHQWHRGKAGTLPSVQQRIPDQRSRPATTHSQSGSLRHLICAVMLCPPCSCLDVQEAMYEGLTLEYGQVRTLPSSSHNMQ